MVLICDAAWPTDAIWGYGPPPPPFTPIFFRPCPSDPGLEMTPIVALLPLKTRDAVCQYDLVGVADMRLADV